MKLTAHFRQVSRLRLRGDKPPLNHYVVMACTRKTVTLTRKFVPFLCIHRKILSTYLVFLYSRFTVTVSGQLYSLPSIVRVVKSRRMRWAGHVARMEEDRGVHRVLVEKPEGKRPLGRPRRRWQDNIKIDS